MKNKIFVDDFGPPPEGQFTNEGFIRQEPRSSFEDRLVDRNSKEYHISRSIGSPSDSGVCLYCGTDVIPKRYDGLLYCPVCFELFDDKGKFPL